MIRTVLVAIDETDNNIFAKECRKYFLEPITFNADGNSQKVIPACDAAILAVGFSSHENIWKVKDEYKGKPIFVPVQGFSSIREEFENAVFGPHVLKLLRKHVDPVPGGGGPKTWTNSSRISYLLARFHDIGMKFKGKDLAEKASILLKEDVTTMVNQSLNNYALNGVLTRVGTGTFIFNGITERMYENLFEAGIPVRQDWIKGRIIVKPNNQPMIPLREDEPVPVFEAAPEPVHVPAVDSRLSQVHEETLASNQLLLEAMTKQQSFIEGLEARLSNLVRNEIQHEIRGITNLLGNIVPQLQGLAPEQLDTIQQMITLMLKMQGQTPPPPGAPVVRRIGQ
jgi:hypothetical protein